MNNDLIIFAAKTGNAHIAIVESDYKRSQQHFAQAQQQLKDVLERIYPLEQKIRLINGTVIHFVDATHFERLRGLRLDRIETVPSALRLMPERFLETRLSPGVTPDEGIFLSE